MELAIVDFATCSIYSDPSTEDYRKIGEEIYKSFSTIGFVYLKNTGISDSEAENVRRMSKAFFDLNMDTKNKYAINANLFGYVAPGVENNDPTKPGEYKESFDVSGPGLASLESKWPDQELPGFSDIVKKFTTKLGHLAMRILDALSMGMKVKDKKYLQKNHSRINNIRNITTLRPLYYPIIPNDYVIEEGEMRLGEHTDFGSFTILFQDTIGGLQVMGQDGTFIHAKPIPGTALVNIGDCLEFWTKKKLKSTIHRIPMPDKQGPQNKERSSLVYFVTPDYEAELSEIECDDVTNTSLDDVGKPITALQHLQRKYAEVNMPIPD